MFSEKLFIVFENNIFFKIYFCFIFCQLIKSVTSKIYSYIGKIISFKNVNYFELLSAKLKYVVHFQLNIPGMQHLFRLFINNTYYILYLDITILNFVCLISIEFAFI